MQAQIYKTVDTNYKKGLVKCRCGYFKELGDGFNRYFIESCPKCDKGVQTRDQRKVIYYDSGRGSLRADIGSNVYFVLSNGIHVRYSASLQKIEYGTEKYLDKL